LQIAVVILNWNGKELLERFLPSVIKYSEGASLYLADNNSSDDSVAFVKESYPSIQVIVNDNNGGYTKGYNDALKKIEADVYCLLNSDVAVTPNWLKPIVKAFEEMPNTAIIQPKMLDYNSKEHFEYAGAAGGFIDKLGYPFCRGRIFQAIEKDKGQYDDIKEIFWASGACMFIRRKVFFEVGGLDEDYFAHQEEIDLCWRAKNKGYQVYYVGLSHVFHLGGSTLSNMNPKKTFLNFRNSLYSIIKNLPRSTAFTIILLRLVLDAVAAFRFLFQFKPTHFAAIIKAHLSFYWNFRKIFRKREKHSFIKNYYNTKSIVWSHFVHQVSVFKSLVKD